MFEQLDDSKLSTTWTAAAWGAEAGCAVWQPGWLRQAGWGARHLCVHALCGPAYPWRLTDDAAVQITALKS